MSLRQEVEQAMSLRFPEKNGEALIRIEESMEIPQVAEVLLKGLYPNPEEVKRGVQSLHQETSSLLEVLLPRRARLKSWLEELPEQPREAEKYLRETSEQMKRHDQKVAHMETELLSKLAESNPEDLFPVPLGAFAYISYGEFFVKIYLRPLGRAAEVLRLNPESLRQAVRIHFLYLLLLLSGQDLDGRTFKRAGDDPALHGIAVFFALRHLGRLGQEVVDGYGEWLKAWGANKGGVTISPESSIEKVRAALVFWRRNKKLSWEEAWDKVARLDGQEFLPHMERGGKGWFFD